MFRGLVAKTFLALTIVISSVMGIYAAYQMISTAETLQENWRQLHEVNIIGIVPSQGLALWGLYKDSAKTSLLPSFDYGEVSRIQVYDDLGKGFVGLKRDSDGKIQSFEPAEMSEALRADLKAHLIDLKVATEDKLAEADAIRKSGKFETNYLTGVHTIYLPVISLQVQKLQHLGYIVTEYTSKKVQAQIVSQKRNIIMLSVGLIITLLCLSFLFLQVSIIRPISKIAKTSLAVAAGNFEKVKNIRNRDEIGILAKNFNFMLQEIEESTKNLNALVHHGKAIASQFTLHDIEMHIRATLRSFLPEEHSTKVYFSHHCYLTETMEHGFYAVDETGHAISSSFLAAEDAESLSGDPIFVIDPRTEIKIAIIQISDFKDEQKVRIKENLKMVAVHVGSALSTVRLEQTFSQLEFKTSALRSIFGNINQGIFTVNEKLAIDSEYSKALEEMVEVKDLTGRSFSEILLRRSNLSGEQVDIIESVMEMSVDQHYIIFKASQGNLPNEVTFHGAKGAKILEIDWTAVTQSDGESVKHYMITLRDVTKLRALQAESEKTKTELDILGQIIALKRSKFNDFMTFGFKVVDSSRVLLEKEVVSENDFLEIKRELHTLKGNARMLGFKSLSETTHEQETAFAALHEQIAAESGDKKYIYTKMIQCCGQIRNMVERYAGIARDKLSFGAQDEQKASGVVLELLEQLDDVLKKNSQVFEGTKVVSLVSRLAARELPTLSKVFFEIQEMIDGVAKSAERPLTDMVVQLGGDWTVKPQIFEALRASLMHLCNNSIDHGLNQKAGTISVRSVVDDEFLVLHYQDSGNGLSLHRIREKGIANRLISADGNVSDVDIASLIFHSGLSTSQHLTDSSGRGVGMDAVKSTIEKIGGKIEIEFTAEIDSNGNRKFRFKIFIPVHHLGRNIANTQNAPLQLRTAGSESLAKSA